MSHGENSTLVKTTGLSLADVYFVLFRHKWGIVLFLLLGIVAAVGLVFLRPPIYQSDAKLLIRYVLERKGVNPVADNSQIKSPEGRGGDILVSEAEILTSRDLAEEVVKIVGPEKILQKLGGGNDINKAAAIVRKNFIAEVPRSGTVIRVTFRHPDPLIVQPVLNRLIEGYLKKHVEVHRGLGLMDEFIARQTDQLRSQLAQTEEDLQKVKSKAGVISLDESKKAYAERLLQISRELLKAEADLAEHKARLQELQKLVSPALKQTNAEPVVPPEKLEEYRSVADQLDTIRRENSKLLVSFTGENPLVKGLRQRIAELEDKKRELEMEYPRLIASAAIALAGAKPGLDPATETAEIAAIQAKVGFLSSQLENIRSEATGIEKVEPEIARLQRQKELQETNYRYFQASLEQKRFDEALGAGKDSSIYVVQTPTPPVIDSSKTSKFVGMTLAGGLFAGIGLAFLIELVFDRRVKRAADVRRKLRMPLLLDIPYLKLNGRTPAQPLLAGNPAPAGAEGGGEEVPARLVDPSPTPDRRDESEDRPASESRLTEIADEHAAQPESRTSAMANKSGGEGAFGRLFKIKSKEVLAEDDQHALQDTSSSSAALKPESNEETMGLVEWQADSSLRPYHEALRDRVILHFESRNMKQKPKLVAVTSCGRHAGVSSISAGLAAVLSETGDGKVLLVDMNLEKGMAHPFYDGKPVVGMSEALDPTKRSSGFAQSNLCLATAKESAPGSLGLPGIIPRRFAHLVPKLKASDFDYIIFDMPPVGQTSATRRLSSLTDLVLMVLESEKTGLDAATQAHSMLTEVKANVAVVLNKSRKHVPAWLNGEL